MHLNRSKEMELEQSVEISQKELQIHKGKLSNTTWQMIVLCS